MYHYQTARDAEYSDPASLRLADVDLLKMCDDRFMHYRVNVHPLTASAFFFGIEGPWYKLIANITDTIPTLKPRRQLFPTPPNIYDVLSFDVGREFSRVIYVKIIKTYYDNQSINWNIVANDIEKLARQAGADEVNTQQDAYSTTIRLWWD